MTFQYEVGYLSQSTWYCLDMTSASWFDLGWISLGIVSVGLTALGGVAFSAAAAVGVVALNGIISTVPKMMPPSSLT